MRIASNLLVVVLLFCVLPPKLALCRAAVTTLHVNVTGSDSNPGTPEAPFATLERAQSSARSANGATVILHAGTYYLSTTLRFTPEDSQTEYRAADGESVVLSG